MNFQPLALVSVPAFLVSCSLLPMDTHAADSMLHLNMRSRVPSPKESNTFTVVEKSATWDPKKTALVVCDMWDDHWCKSAARRVAEMAGPLNEVVKKARAQGLFIIHGPSSVTKFYDGTPQRKLALAAPFVHTPVPL